MQIQKEQKEPSEAQIHSLLKQSQKIIKSEAETGQFKNQYLSFFSDLGEKTGFSKALLVSKLKRAKIKYENSKKHSGFNIRIVRSIRNFQVVTLEVQIGPFTFYLDLYNCSNKNYTHYLQGKASTFATIYDYSAETVKTVIKCTTFKPKDFLDSLIVVLKQYCFLKIAAAIQAGPQITPIFGFDLIAYEDCLQFAMQKCEPLSPIDDKVIKGLKQKLERFHKLHFVHVDIKPQNFCFSPLLNEPIFIDFGLSEVIEEVPGQQTHTSFMGSLNYCSPQMTRLYYESVSGPVDLYYNDTVCMKKSFVDMRKEVGKTEIINFLRQEYDDMNSSNSDNEVDAYPLAAGIGKVIQDFTIMRLKHLIYTQEPLKNWYTKYEEFIKKSKNALLIFLENFPYSKFIELFCDQILSYNKFDRALKNDFIKTIINQNQLTLKQPEQSEVSKQEEEWSASAIAIDRMSQMLSTLTISSVNFSKKQLQQDLNLDTFLQSPKLIEKAEKLTLFNKFSQYTDLRTTTATKAKRQKVAKIMLKYLQIQPSGSDLISNLSQCWRHIFAYTFSHQPQHNMEMISTLLHNLMILQGITYKEFMHIFSEILALEIESIRKCELMYICVMSSTWALQRIFTSNEYNSSKGDTINFLIRQLKKLRDTLSREIIAITLSLIFDTLMDDERQIVQNYEILGLLQKNANSLTYSVYYDMKRNLHSRIVVSQYSKNKQNYKKEFSQFISSQKKGFFNYYHLNIIKYCNWSRNVKLKQYLLSVLQNCFQPLNLLENFYLNDELHKISSKQFYGKLVDSINPDMIQNSYKAVVILQRIVRKVSSNPKKDQNHEILQEIGSRVDFQLITKCITTVRDEKMRCSLVYQTYYLLFAIYNQINHLRPDFQTKIIDLISKLKQKWMTDRCNYCRLTTYYIFILIQSKCYLMLNKQKLVLEKLTQHMISLQKQKHNMEKSHMHYFLEEMCRLVKELNEVPTNPYSIAVIYGAFIYTKNWRPLLTNNIYAGKIFYQIGFHLIKMPSKEQFFKFHHYIWEQIQKEQDYTQMNNYVIHCMYFFHKHKDELMPFNSQAKRLTKNSIKIAQGYNASCILLLIIMLKKRQNQVSSIVLQIVAKSLPRIKSQAKVVLSTLLYNYLIYFQIPLDNPLRETLTPPYNHIILYVKKLLVKRKISFFARKIIKTLMVHPKQASFYSSCLISKYKKKNLYHKLFYRNLIKVYRNTITKQFLKNYKKNV